MISLTLKTLKSYWEQWAKNRVSPGPQQTLNSRNVYILPSRFGWAYGLVIIASFVGATNYQINTIYLMTFLLATIGLVNALEAHANINNLSIKLLSIEDAQAGTPAKIHLFIHANQKIRYGIQFQIHTQAITRLEKIPTEGLHFILPIETNHRGYFALPRISISSLFPFGLFRVWSYLYFKEHYYAYPQPIDPGFWPETSLDQNLVKKYARGDEEFYDLKQVQNPWIAPNLIAWKIAAKDQGWYLKTMDTNEVNYLLFKLNDLSVGDLESKLQYLSYWLHTAEQNSLVYALELTTHSRTRFAFGKEHLQHCLRQLALYP